MKVGDILQDREYGDIGLVVKIDKEREKNHPFPRNHLILNCEYGNLVWLEKDYLFEECEVINEER
jgi:hypothetical protein